MQQVKWEFEPELPITLIHDSYRQEFNRHKTLSLLLLLLLLEEVVVVVLLLLWLLLFPPLFNAQHPILGDSRH